MFNNSSIRSAPSRSALARIVLGLACSLALNVSGAQAQGIGPHIPPKLATPRATPTPQTSNSVITRGLGVVSVQNDPTLHLNGPLPLGPKPAPPQDFGLDQWWSMSVQFPNSQDSIGGSSPNDVVRVPWTNVFIPVGVQLTERGPASADDSADFSVQPQLCLTPDQAAAYPLQNQPRDWRGFSVLLEPSQEQCTQQPYGTLGSWYLVYDDGGAALFPYSQHIRLDGSQSPGSGGPSNVIKLYWHLPFISNTLRLHLFVDSSVGSTDQLTDAVNVMVLPAALMQLKVLPYTILYAPPGGNSTASYQGSTSFATTMTVGSNSTIDNTASQTRINGSNDTISASAFGLSFDLAGDSSWDQTVMSGVGLATSSSTALTRSDKLTYTLGSPAAGGAAQAAQESYPNEPFWNDEIVLLLHPQLAVWDLGGKADVQMLGALGTQTAPTFARPSVRHLDTCAQGGGLMDEALAHNGISLTADECAALLTLDPFYLSGQPAAPTTTRAQHITEQEYGADKGSYDLKDEKETQLRQETVKEASYSATVEDIHSTTETMGVQLLEGSKDEISLTGGLKDSAGNRAAYDTKMNVTYRQSNAVTEDQTIVIEGKLDDAKSSHLVDIYFDNTFGTWMFVDPDAEVSPAVRARDNSKAAGGSGRVGGGQTVSECGRAPLPQCPTH